MSGSYDGPVYTRAGDRPKSLQSGGASHAEPMAAASMIDNGRRASRIQQLALRYSGLDGEALLRPMIKGEFRGRIAAVSSFGAESAIVLALVAAIEPRTPVLFLDTGKLFSETLRYRDRLVAKLGLEDVRTIRPDPQRLAETDPEGALWLTDPDQCCRMRKVEPLAEPLSGFDAWITGRKRYHGADRACLPLFEDAGDGRIKINPVAGWSPERVKDEFAARNLPHHPLEAQGFLSIGCVTCTDRVWPGEDQRAGRWRGREKTECGIHLSVTSANTKRLPHRGTDASQPDRRNPTTGGGGDWGNRETIRIAVEKYLV